MKRKANAMRRDPNHLHSYHSFLYYHSVFTYLTGIVTFTLLSWTHRVPSTGMGRFRSILPLTVVASTATHADIIYHTMIQFEDLSIQNFTLQRNEEPVDAIYQFALLHGLDPTHRKVLLQHVCSSKDLPISCTRDQAVIFRTTVSSQDQWIDTFLLMEGVEPVDAAHQFVLQHNLTMGYRQAILREACDVVPCLRILPVVWNYTVLLDKKVIHIELLEGDELADVIFHTFAPLGTTFEQRQQILDIAEKQGVTFTRKYALVFDKEIRLDHDRVIPKSLQIWDDGKEPIDAIYEFMQETNFTHYFQYLADSVLPHICSQLLPCTRKIPRIWSHPVTTSDGLHQLALLEILKDEEPIDAIDSFTIRHRLSHDFRDHLLQSACNVLPCQRSTPVVFRKTVNDDSGNSIGHVEILEGEEVVDAVVRFLRKLNRSDFDHISFKNYFFQNACPFPRVKCTRNVAHVFRKRFNHENGTSLGELVITEHEEPADKVYSWVSLMNLSPTYFDFIMAHVCETEGVTCNRKLPLVFSFPLNGPDGQYIGNFEVQLGEEPVDALYKFFARHELFSKQWDFQAVVHQICNLPNLMCQRRTAVKYFAENFLMGNHTNVGSLIVWENEEVIDKLYAKRIEYNLTMEDQMRSFGEICSKSDVFCGRTRAVIYKLTEITKRDYEKFGNETCIRKYAGWQYLSSIAGSSLGSKASNFVKQEFVITSLSHPLLSPSLFWCLLFLARIACKRITAKVTIHIGHKIVIVGALLITISILQVAIIEPENRIDEAMHLYEGKLPDLVLLEEEELADVLLRWGKLEAKDHHPIVREPIYWDIFDKVCSELPRENCNRRRAWHRIDMGFMTVSGQTYEIIYFDRSVDPRSKKTCKPISGRFYDSCVEQYAVSFCTRIQPHPVDCPEIIAAHVYNQLNEYYKNRFDSKDSYVKLGLEMDAPDSELYSKLASLARIRGMNVPPFRRIDNGTHVYYDWDKPTREAIVAVETHKKVKDPVSREWNDKPCTPYFGGALCAKQDKDGNMLIEV